MNKIFLAIIILFLSLVIFADENLINKDNKSDKYEIEIDKQVHKVFFKLKDTGEIFKSIDLIKENPYNEIPYSVVKISKSGSKYYGKIKHNKIFTNRSNFHPKIEEKISELDVELHVNYHAGVHNNNYLVIYYNLISNLYEDYYGEKTTIRVYTKQGDLLIEKNDLVGEGGDVTIDEKGNYILYYTGELFEFDNTELYSNASGYKLLSLDKGIVEIEKMSNDDFICDSIEFIEGYGNILWRSKDGIMCKHQVININKRKIFSKTLNFSDYSSTKKEIMHGIKTKGDTELIIKNYSEEVF